MRTLILLGFIVICASCQEEEGEKIGGNDHYNISENLYPLLYIPESYWVYENQTGSLDSVILIYCEADTLGPFKTGDCCTMTQEVYNLEYESSKYGSFTEHFIGYVIKRGSIDGAYIYLSSFDVGDNRNNTSIADIHDSLIIAGVTYYQIVEMEISKDDYISSDMRLFYVDSVGVIQKILIDNLNDSIIWQLIEYNTTLLFE